MLLGDEGIGNHPERVGRQIEDDPAGYQLRGSAGRRAGKRASAQADGIVSYNIMNVPHSFGTLNAVMTQEANVLL